MKLVFTLDIKIDGYLKVKRCTIVITSYKASSNSKGKVEKEEQVSSNHVTVRVIDDLETK